MQREQWNSHLLTLSSPTGLLIRAGGPWEIFSFVVPLPPLPPSFPPKYPLMPRTNIPPKPKHREKKIKHGRFGKCHYFCSKSFVQSLIGLYSRTTQKLLFIYLLASFPHRAVWWVLNSSVTGITDVNQDHTATLHRSFCRDYPKEYKLTVKIVLDCWLQCWLLCVKKTALCKSQEPREWWQEWSKEGWKSIY